MRRLIRCHCRAKLRDWLTGPRLAIWSEYYAALANTDHATVLEQHGGKGFGPFKSALIDLVVEQLTPIASETRRRLADEGSIVSVLHAGAERAAAIAEPIVAEAERLVGLVRTAG